MIKHSWEVSANRDPQFTIHVVKALLHPGNATLSCIGHLKTKRLVFVDSGLPSCLHERIVAYFSAYGIRAKIVSVSGGEACKSFEAVQSITTEMETFHLNRRGEPIIIFGGGAVLDVVGFAASIFRRGVPFVRIPTTLLAYVDAAVGIKTGINFFGCKNLIGSFATPAAVLLDVEQLCSLPQEEISCGLGEVLKLGVGCDKRLITLMEEATPFLLSKELNHPRCQAMLHRSIEIMIEQLSSNLYENNLQRLVDLGHTFSQKFELSENGSGMRHGDAVTLDICLFLIISLQRNLLSKSELDRVIRLIRSCNMPCDLSEVDVEDLWDSVLERVRHRGGKQNIPLPVQLGKCIFINDLSFEDLARAYQGFRYYFGSNEEQLPLVSQGLRQSLQQDS